MTFIGHTDLGQRKKRQGYSPAYYSGSYRQMQCAQFQEQQSVVRGLLG